MTDHDPRIDAYIADAPPFAQPILERLRTLVHSTCPEIEEGIKWNKPFFGYQGSPLCMMAAFKQHGGFSFWRSKQVVGKTTDEGMGQFGKLRRVADLRTEKHLADLLRTARALNEAGVKPKKNKPVDKTTHDVPPHRQLSLRSPNMLPHAQSTMGSVRVSSANGSNGSTKPKPMPPAESVSLPRSNGWTKANNTTGNMPNDGIPRAMIRPAHDDDAAAIHAIYAPAVIHGAATFETALPGVDAMRERIQTKLQHYPWLVWEDHGRVLAYAYAGRFRDRAAYDWIAETSIYVDADAQRRGIARKLYGALLELMRQQGIHQAVGAITLPGDASVAMHQTMGFAEAGVWRRCGYKLGQWWDVGIWQKELQPMQDPPAPVIPFSQLVASGTLTGLDG
jgi:L-amino acid N-acyltransferase YncA